jgi:Ca2+-binding RTX toxin-like protein
MESLEGGAHADSLTGNAGLNMFTGNNGADTLTGLGARTSSRKAPRPAEPT